MAAVSQASSRVCAPCESFLTRGVYTTSTVRQNAHVGVGLKAKHCPAIRPSRTWVVPRASAVETGVDIEALVGAVKKMTLAQAREFTDRLQRELGVSAAAYAPAAGGGAAAPAEAAPAVEEKTDFDIILEEVPTSARIAVIKVIRAATGLGLKESKDLIEGLPKTVKEAVAKEDAEDLKKQLETAGAKVNLK